MRAIPIHPFSTLAGVGLLGLVLVATGAVQTQLQVRPFPYCTHELVPPQDLVVIREGVPYTVPVGKRMVVTAIGSANPTVASVQVLIDGVPEVTTHTETPTTMRQVPHWLVVNPGSSMAVAGGDGTPSDCRAWGYLVDA